VKTKPTWPFAGPADGVNGGDGTVAVRWDTMTSGREGVGGTVVVVVVVLGAAVAAWAEAGRVTVGGAQFKPASKAVVERLATSA
jgi:hypothetical protein